jgi:adenylylsulfate kinase-like enzyme
MGLSGAGKSTLANELARNLEVREFKVSIQDGDIVRAADHRPLGFSAPAIIKNGQRMIEQCETVLEAHDFVLVSLITPFETVREEARQRFRPQYLEIFLSTSAEECRRRDTKGLYSKEARGELDNLIGVSPGSPFELPSQPDLVLDTKEKTVEECASLVFSALQEQSLL